MLWLGTNTKCFLIFLSVDILLYSPFMLKYAEIFLLQPTVSFFAGVYGAGFCLVAKNPHPPGGDEVSGQEKFCVPNIGF